MSVPHTKDILALPHAQRTTTNLRLVRVLAPVRSARSVSAPPAPQLRARPAVVELVADYGYDDFLPESVCDALLEPDDPLAALYVHRVLPDGPPDPGMKEEVVRGGLERRRSIEVCPKRPEGFNLSALTIETRKGEFLCKYIQVLSIYCNF